MIIVTDLKPGMSFEYEGNIYTVLDILHNKTAMRQMIVKTKVKNLRTGAVTEINFTGGGKVEGVHLDKRQMEYLYDDGTGLVFMDTETYEQVSIPKDRLDWELKFLTSNCVVEVIYYESEILGVNLPSKVKLRVVHTEPAVKGDTATRAMKEAELETGLVVKVPLFIENDELLIIRTDTGEYDSRA